MPETRATRPRVDEATLHRLVADVPGARPVVSIYVDLDPHDFPTPAARAAEINALLDAARRSPGAHDLGNATDAVLRRLGAALHEHAANGLALAGFGRYDSGADVIELQRSVEPDASVGVLPHLMPLLAATASDRWCVALVTRRTSRLLLGDAFELDEAERIEDDVHRPHSRGGWSVLAQTRFRRSIEHDIDEHYRRTGAALAELHRVRPFDRLLLAGPGETLGAMTAALNQELRSLIDGELHVDVERATPGEVLDHAQASIRVDEESRERAQLARLSEEGGGGRAAAGVDDTLVALQDQRVDTLVIAEGLREQARCCLGCRWMSGSEAACPAHPAQTTTCDAADAALVSALRQSLAIVVVRHLSKELMARGGMAASLRY